MTMPGAPPSFFPVDVSSVAEFVATYAVIGVLGLAVGKLIATLVASAFDRSAPEASRAARGAASDDPHEPLTEGFLPKPDELPAVGYLKGGLDGFSAAIVADALATGWLYHVPGTRVGARGSYALGRLPKDASTLAAELATALSRKGPLDPAAVRDAARAVALRHEAATLAQLEAAGLSRTFAERLGASLAMWIVTGLVLAIGVLRCVRDHALGASLAPALLETALFAAGAVAFSGVPRRSDRGQRYVDWLEVSTTALRRRVAEGAEPSVADTALAAALVGLGAGPELAGLAAPRASARPLTRRRSSPAPPDT